LRFKIGEFRCLIVSDGLLKVPDPPAARAGGVAGLPRGEDIEVLCLLIETGKHRILVDTGCGTRFQPTTGKLVSNLKMAGVQPGEIDIIVHTHGHGDHVGGSFDAQGQPVFPNARFKVAKIEWDYWNRPDDGSLKQRMFAAARKYYLQIPDKIDLVDEEAEIIPGLRLSPAPGHTPGNSLLDVQSGGDGLLCIGDAIHSAREFKNPEFYTFLDVIPEQALKSRSQILARAAGAGLIIFACHFPFPGLGRIVRTGQEFKWLPVHFPDS